MSGEEEVYFIDNFSILGKFFAHYGPLKGDNLMLHPVYKLMEGNIYQPGYRDVNSQFFACPLLIHYVQLDKILNIPKVSKNPFDYFYMEMHFRLFNNDHTELRNGIIRLFQKGASGLSFQNFNDRINLLNRYVANGNNMHEVDFNKLGSNLPQIQDKSIILKVLNNLDIRFYENSKYRTYKDNLYWVEAEIRNLPNQNYLRDLLKKSILKQCRGLHETNFGLELKFEFDDNGLYTRPFDRRLLNNSGPFNDNFLDILKLDMALGFDADRLNFDEIKFDSPKV
tara:strand:+ start:10022 stop:10867 length:846 start_codon:yes stop_codon:yes gene_type:complete